MQAPAPVRHHPNASLAVGAGTPAGGMIWAAGHFGVSLSAEDGAYITTGVIALSLAIGRRGISGIMKRVWRGEE